MRLHRFYIGSNPIDKKEINTLSDKVIAHQVRSVFRLHEGDRTIFFNDSGYEYVSELVSCSRDTLTFRVVEERFVERSTELHLALAFSLIKKDHAEWIIEKGTEIGASEFVPLVSDRSEKKGFNTERAYRKAVEATEQSGRVDVPRIHDPISFEQYLSSETRPMIAFHTVGDRYADVRLPTSGNVVALVGPEGGWSDREVELLKNKNIPLVKLNSPVLRAETAATVIAALLLIK